MDIVFCNEQEAEALCQVRHAGRRSLLLTGLSMRRAWHMLGTAPGTCAAEHAVGTGGGEAAHPLCAPQSSLLLI